MPGKQKRKNRRVSVLVSHTVNIGDFNSVKVQAGLDYDIPDDSNINKEYKGAFNTVTKHVLKYRDSMDI